jgi:hypothetical protein
MGTAHMTIEVDVGSRPISGLLYDTKGTPRGFCGWMQLASVLQAAVDSLAWSEGPQPMHLTEREMPQIAHSFPRIRGR